MTGTIYIVQAGASGPVKIGYAAKMAPHIGMLQRTKLHLTLLRTFSGSRQAAAKMTWRFADQHLCDGWFKLVPEMLTVDAAELLNRRRVIKPRALEIRRLYESGMLCTEIAAKLGITQQAVSANLIHQGYTPRASKPRIPPKPRTPRTLVITPERAAEMYRSGLSVQQIADACGCTVVHVSNVLRKAGIRKRAVRSDKGVSRPRSPVAPPGAA